MPTPANPKRLIELGTPVELAKEIAAQTTAKAGNWKRLIELGMDPAAAKELAAQINAAGTIDAKRLHGIGRLSGPMAREMAAQISAAR